MQLSRYFSGVPVNQLGSLEHFHHKNEAFTVYLYLCNFASSQKRPSNGVLLIGNITSKCGDSRFPNRREPTGTDKKKVNILRQNGD